MPVSRVAATIGAKQGRPTAADAAKRRAANRRMRKKNTSNGPENIGCYGNAHHDKLARACAALRDAKWFQTSVIGVIFIAGALVGLQTYGVSGTGVDVLDGIVLVIFILELVVKMVAEGNRPHNFFRDAWNVFDFLIVVVGLLPFGGSAVTALRLVRLLRVLKLVRALPKLRILVMGLLKSMSSIAYIGLLLGLLFYLYAVLGVSLFGANDPVTMGTLHIATLTLFRCATLEDWTDVMYTAMYGCENYGYGGIEDQCVKSEQQGLLSAAYFCSFIILSSMMILNLFIGVITSSMQDAKADLSAELEAEQAAKQQGEQEEPVESRLEELVELLASVEAEVAKFAQLEKERKASSVITLSENNVLANAEVEVIAKYADKAEESLKTAMSERNMQLKRAEARDASDAKKNTPPKAPADSVGAAAGESTAERS